MKRPQQLYVWDLDEDFDGREVEDLYRSLPKDSHYFVAVIGAEDYDATFHHPAGYQWPYTRKSEYDNEFYEMGEGKGEAFGSDWLAVNTWIRDALWANNLDASNSLMRWLAFKIAEKVCTMLKAEGETNEQCDSS
jgi:hypothetical protein